MPGGRLHAGVLVLLVLPLVAWWLQRRTVLGYEMRMTGHNRWFADYGGVDGRRTVLLTMLISGAVCGLAGALLVLGVHYRYIDNSIIGAGLRVDRLHGGAARLRATRSGACSPALFLAGARGRGRRHGATHRDPDPDRGHRPGRDHPHDLDPASCSGAGSAGGWGRSDAPTAAHGAR